MERFDFIDLFAGIGGLRQGFEAHGGRCVFSSEIDKFARQTYEVNYGAAHPIEHDIRAVAAEDVPDHDVLLAGFPCQPFSIAGVSKCNSLGYSHGFEDKTKGTLFFDVARIIKAKRPRAFLLENVKNLVSHDKGNTFRAIRQALRDELGYHVDYRVVDSQGFTPQRRERILIAGFREGVRFSWDELILPKCGPLLGSILHEGNGTEPHLGHDGDRFFNHGEAAVHSRYTLTESMWGWLQRHKEKHERSGNGFGYGLVSHESVARTLSSRYYKDGSEILLAQGNGDRPRRLTPRECARLMGFADDFVIPVSDTQAYKQFGNSVVVPAIREAARIIVAAMATTKGVPRQRESAHSEGYAEGFAVVTA